MPASFTFTALAMMLAAASAPEAVRDGTVTLSAMPSEKLRPRQPLVAAPRTGMALEDFKLSVGADATQNLVGIEVFKVGIQANTQGLAGRQVQGNVAAVVDPRY